MKILDYMIVRAFDVAVLRAKVNEAIDKGYEPQGGVAYDWEGGFAQALVVREVVREKEAQREDG